MAKDNEPTGNTKRCPRCETTKHRSVFSSMGYCRPCSRDYARERAASGRAKESATSPILEKPVLASQPKQDTTTESPAEAAAELSPSPSTIADVVRNVQARAAPRGTIARALAPELRIGEPDRRRLLLRALGAALVHVLRDGEELTVSALRVGSCVVIEGLDVSVSGS